ncbi:MAG: winged helix-turn-helix transcriptional regulator [Myxococcales bacterium FL481]|nr:MAG: winged helix-turn-helix transcriptional regulator [Myxococcales bacterium FL481]
MYSTSYHIVKEIGLSASTKPEPERKERSWTFLSNHAHVLLCLARDPDMRLRDVADAVGITERATHRIVTELEAVGVIERIREGRRNHYEVDSSIALRHPLEADRTVGSLLESLLEPADARRLGLRARPRKKSV